MENLAVFEAYNTNQALASYSVKILSMFASVRVSRTQFA